MLIETHAHLDYPDFAPDFDDVLRRATDAGVTRIITIGTSIRQQACGRSCREASKCLRGRWRSPTHVEGAEEDVIDRSAVSPKIRGSSRLANRPGLSFAPEPGAPNERKETEIFQSVQTST